MNVFKIYKNTKAKDEREWFLLSVMGIFFILLLIFLVIFFEKGTRLYYRSNNGLFIIDVMFFLLFVGGKEKTKELLKKTMNFFQNKLEMTLYNIGDLLLLSMYTIAIVSFIFVLDLSFLNNYGIRISAVVGVILTKLIKDLFFF